MKIVFFGTPDIAAAVLKRLIASRHDVIAVVTQPDRAKGRGKTVAFSPVKELALENGIKILQPEKVGDDLFLDDLEALGADIHAVTAYAQKLPSRLLEMAPKGCINVHPSLLPKYRGAIPIPAAILNGDDVSGVTIMNMAEKMDAGDILLQRRIPLAGDETTQSLEKKAAEVGAELLIEAIDAIEAGTIEPVRQDDSKSTYVKQLKKEDGLIDFAESAVQIEREIRAYTPWPGSFTYLNGQVFKIWKAAVCEEVPGSNAVPGTVVHADKKSVKIKCGEGVLSLLEVQIQGKKMMGIEEFLRGKKIEQEYIFGK